MARRRKVPVIGANTLHPVQIAPQIRHLEGKRARRAAHREYAPTLAADRQEQQAIRGEYGRELGATRGANSIVESSLGAALAGLGSSGLTGKYKGQVASEFKSRMGDIAASLPYLLQGVKEERGKALRTARSNFLQDRAQMQQSAVSRREQRLKELRGQGSSALKEQQTKRESEAKEQKSSGRSFNNALLTAEKGYREILEAVRSGVKDKEGNPIKPPSSKTDWLHFAAQVENEADGVDMTTAVKAVEKLRADLYRKFKRHFTNPPF